AVTRSDIERLIRLFYDGCNEASAEKMHACLHTNAVHYFPLGAPQGIFRGSDAIVAAWQASVARWGSRWTIDRLYVDEGEPMAVVEWTHFKERANGRARGAEVVELGDDGRITEIRPYYAAPAADPEQVYELADFAYAERDFGAAGS